jgi:glycosyltransferase involved in cell wall biosynthesis
MDVSVVLRTYTERRWDDLAAAVASMRPQTVRPCEVIVVVDHNPALLARVRRTFPEVVAIENTQPRGSSGGWNSGIAAARGDVVAFMDDDAEAAPDWIEQLLAGYVGPEVAGVGGHIQPVWQEGRPGWFPEEFDWVVGCTYRGLPGALAPVRNLIGCNMSFRRAALLEGGGFRGHESGIGHLGAKPVGGDETEFCIRLQQTHPEVVLLYNPAARVRHHVPVSRARWAYLIQRCYLEGRSKARVARLVGASAGLSAERSYTLSALPKGIARGLADTVAGQDITGLGRAGSIVAGLACTAAGYMLGTLTSS